MSQYPNVPNEVGASLDSGDLAHLCLHPHTCLSLISAYLVIPSLVYVSTFFPKIKSKRDSCVQAQISENSIQACIPGNIEESHGSHSFRGGCTPFFSAFLQNTSTTTTKSHVGNLVSFESPLTAEHGGGPAAVSNRYHVDIFNSLCCSQSHLQTVNWRKRFLKNMKSSFAWWDIFIPE